MDKSTKSIRTVAKTKTDVDMDKDAALQPQSVGPPDMSGVGIATVERETGFGKDTLRVWERRYGFPQPLRSSNGERMYPPAQVRKLLRIRQLVQAGWRPGKVVPLSDAQLGELLKRHAERGSDEGHAPVSGLAAGHQQILMDLLHAHDHQGLRTGLRHAQMQLGLSQFVTELVAPMTTQVGVAWEEGRFDIFQEHLYSEVLTGVLREACTLMGSAQAPLPTDRPSVLLTTLPNEPHGLGLLMVECLLALEGCACVSLGVQTPPGDIAQAVRAHQSEVLALSFSAWRSGPSVLAELRALRALIPQEVDIWVGGAGVAPLRKPPIGIRAVPSLSALSPLLHQWRTRHRIG